MFEPDWDGQISRILDELGTVGVAGFFGAKGVGSHDLYRSSYSIAQLVRVENVSGCRRMGSHHGHRPAPGEFEEVAVLDGFCLIVRRVLLDELGGFDSNLPPHHNDDNTRASSRSTSATSTS
jgi:GT2 family glycosyltransferase